jgi:hypothetical protein
MAAVIKTIESGFTPHRVGVAAEGFTAGLLAHAGYDVLVQYGANQPDYDLVAAKPNRVLRVSVKGSQLNGWGLTQSYLAKADYHRAADAWLVAQASVDIFVLVKFEGIKVGECPNVWVARPKEIAEHLKLCRGGNGVTTLFVNSGTFIRGIAKGVCDRIPEKWVFSQSRIDSV